LITCLSRKPKIPNASTKNSTKVPKRPAFDPLAPNWRIEQQGLGADRYAFALTKKRFATGGDGEAMQVFKRRVDQLASEKGYAGFELLEYTEAIESHVPIAQRVSRGVVQFARAR